MNGKRNLWVRVTNRKRYVRDEGRPETGRERVERWIEENKGRRERETRME